MSEEKEEEEEEEEEEGYSRTLVWNSGGERASRSEQRETEREREREREDHLGWTRGLLCSRVPQAEPLIAPEAGDSRCTCPHLLHPRWLW